MWLKKRIDRRIAWNHMVKIAVYSCRIRTSKLRKNKRALLLWPIRSQVRNAGYDSRLLDDKNLIKACLVPSINISRKKWTEDLNRHMRRNLSSIGLKCLSKEYARSHA